MRQHSYSGGLSRYVFAHSMQGDGNGSLDFDEWLEMMKRQSSLFKGEGWGVGWVSRGFQVAS